MNVGDDGLDGWVNNFISQGYKMVVLVFFMLTETLLWL